MSVEFLRAWSSRYRQRSLDVRSWSQLPGLPAVRGASLALVGNASYLREIAQGPRIDECDLVIRMNNFRTAGFEAAVGTRTDVVLTNFFRDIDFNNPEFRQASLFVSSCPNNFRNLRRQGVHHRHADHITTVMTQLGRQRVYVPPVNFFLQQLGRFGKYPTTGAMGILLILHYLLEVCGPVYLTGFSFFQGGSHYFSDRDVIPVNHDPAREQVLIESQLRSHVDAGRIVLDDLMLHNLRRRVA